MFKALINFFGQNATSEGIKNKKERANVYAFKYPGRLLKKDSVRRGGVYGVVCITIKVANVIIIHDDINFFDDTCAIGDTVKVYSNHNGTVQVYRSED